MINAGDLARRRGEMPFLDHLEELRMRIIWSLLAVAVGAVMGFLLIRYFDVLELLIQPIRAALPDEPNFTLKYFSPADPFFITLKLSVVVGLILAFPIIIYHVWSFLSPALETHEKKAIIPALYLGLVLFCAGVALAYYVALPVSIVFFQTFEGGLMEAQYEIGRTLTLITKILIGFGIIFELPVVIMILSALGLVTPEFLRSKRRHAIVAITVAASFLTPGDVITLTVMLMVPLFFLYEFSIYLSKLIWRGKRLREMREREEEERPPPAGPPGGAPPTGGAAGAGPGGGSRDPDGNAGGSGQGDAPPPDSVTGGPTIMPPDGGGSGRREPGDRPGQDGSDGAAGGDLPAGGSGENEPDPESEEAASRVAEDDSAAGGPVDGTSRGSDDHAKPEEPGKRRALTEEEAGAREPEVPDPDPARKDPPADPEGNTEK